MWEIGKEGLLRENIELEYILAFGRQNKLFDKKSAIDNQYFVD